MRQPPLLAHIIFTLGTGGLENGLVNIINRCPPSRYRHAIICLSHAENFSQRLTTPGVEVIELHKKPGHDIGMYWRLWRHLRRLRPDIIHTRNLAALETQALGLLMPGCKRVHGEHGRDIHDLDGSNRKYNNLRRVLNPLIHRFVAVSQDLSNWLIETVRIAEGKVKQIYNGVDTTRFRPQTEIAGKETPHVPENFQPNRDRVIVGTVGRLATVKNQRILIDALHQLLNDRGELRTTLRLLIVGDGPERSALEDQIKRLSLEDQVWLTGDREDIPQLLRIMDIFVLPSLGEGISNTILEAMASGLPVIASDVGGNPELVQEGRTGMLFPTGNTDALAHALLALAADKTLRQEMGNAAVMHIKQNFDWQRTVESYLALYDDLLYPRAVRSGAEGR